MSVKITGYKQVTTAAGKTFNLLEISDGNGVEMAVSATTGLPYLTEKKAFISCTFDEKKCQALIGSTMPGSIEKVETEPFEYTNRNGKTSTITHRYQYMPEVDSKSLMAEPTRSQNPFEEAVMA
jgi:hypothetical protein